MAHFRKYLHIATLALLLSCSLHSTNTSAQTELWDTYMSRFGDRPASILVDMGLILTAPDVRYPYLVITGPKALHSDKNGIPVKEEIASLEDILDATGNFLTGLTAKKLAGTLTYNGQRNNYYYVRDTMGIRNAIMRMYTRNFKDYKFALTIKYDPQWLMYRTFLYPSNETQNWMDNNKIITQMLQNGDSLTKPRNITFAACFNADSSRNAFTTFITNSGYTVDKDHTVKNTDYPLCMLFHKYGYIKKDSINIITDEIRNNVKVHNGIYNGWNAPFKQLTDTTGTKVTH